MPINTLCLLTSTACHSAEKNAEKKLSVLNRPIPDLHGDANCHGSNSKSRSIFRDSNSVIALGANVPAPCPRKPYQVRHQERHGFKLSKMRSAVNVRPQIAIRRAGNALVKSISTVFLKPTPSSTIPEMAPMGIDPYPNKAADTNPNCLNCSHGPTNQINIEKVGEDNFVDEYQPSDGSYTGDEYFFSEDDEEKEEEE